MPAADEIERSEKLAEAAYEAMYEAMPYAVKDCFDDARSYFTKAIETAKHAELKDEVARLNARLDHIVSVYNSQFRGIGDTGIVMDEEYRVEDRFDMAFLIWPGGEFFIGDHCYTDPQCAVINADAGWCVSGGQGLEICIFEDGFPRGPKLPEPSRVKRLQLWRYENPPPDGERYWLVVKVWHYHADRVRVLVNPLGQAAGLYEVDVRTLQWERL